MQKHLLFLSLIVLLLLGGCTPNFGSFDKEDPVSNLPPEAVYIDGNSIYNLTTDLINSARKSIYIDQAEFNDARLIQLLIQKAREG